MNRNITVNELKNIIVDPSELKKGTEIYDGGKLNHLARYENRIFAEAQGSGKNPYRITIDLAEQDSNIKAACSCFAARSRPFCKHASALLVAWARQPEAFAESDTPPPESRNASKKKTVKKGKKDSAALMKTGIEQVNTLARELAVSGIASVSRERIEQIRVIGESLRENRLRRLSSRCLDLVEFLQLTDQGQVNEMQYAQTVVDITLTAAKIRKHLEGETLDKKYVEELIGKTWRKNDRTPVDHLDLLEYAHGARITSDNYIIRESRFIDLNTATHYSEKQILPANIDKRSTPKQSYFGKLLQGVSGSIYPGFAPFRLQIEEIGHQIDVDQMILENLLSQISATEIPDSINQYLNYRKDVFAPNAQPAAIKAETVLAEGGRLRVMDRNGFALHLPKSIWFEEMLSDAIRGNQLRALLGEMVTDMALTTLRPFAAIVEQHGKLALYKLLDPTDPNHGLEMQHSMNWSEAATNAGLSAAPIALAEIREGLGQCLVSGLSGLSESVILPYFQRLNDLGLNKQADLLKELSRHNDPFDRVAGFIKLYQLLEVAMFKLGGSAKAEGLETEPVPTYPSVKVRKQQERFSPELISRKQMNGEINEYEAALHLSHYYSQLSQEQLATDPWVWADAGARPYIVHNLAQTGDAAVHAARAMLARNVGRSTEITALHLLEAIASKAAEQEIRNIAKRRKKFSFSGFWIANDTSLEGLAADCLVRLQAEDANKEVRARMNEVGAKMPKYIDMLLAGSDKSHRAEAADHLSNLGCTQAIPALREAFHNDITHTVREHAAYALASLGDASLARHLISQLENRTEYDETSKTAAYALGILGDTRGLQALLQAYLSGWKPGVLSDAISHFGVTAINPVLDLAIQHPDLCKRQTLLNVALRMPGEELTELLKHRITNSRDLVSMQELSVYLNFSATHETSHKEIARIVMSMVESANDKDGKSLARAAKKALTK